MISSTNNNLKMLNVIGRPIHSICRYLSSLQHLLLFHFFLSDIFTMQTRIFDYLKKMNRKYDIINTENHFFQ